MLNLIKNFIADERGAETTELAITSLVVGGGAVVGYNNLKGKIGEKQDELLGKLDESSAD